MTAFSSATAPGTNNGDGFANYDAVASCGDNGSGQVTGSQAVGVLTVSRPSNNDRMARMWPTVQ